MTQWGLVSQVGKQVAQNRHEGNNALHIVNLGRSQGHSLVLVLHLKHQLVLLQLCLELSQLLFNLALTRKECMNRSAPSSDHSPLNK